MVTTDRVVQASQSTVVNSCGQSIRKSDVGRLPTNKHARRSTHLHSDKNHVWSYTCHKLSPLTEDSPLMVELPLEDQLRTSCQLSVFSRDFATQHWNSPLATSRNRFLRFVGPTGVSNTLPRSVTTSCLVQQEMTTGRAPTIPQHSPLPLHLVAHTPAKARQVPPRFSRGNCPGPFLRLRDIPPYFRVRAAPLTQELTLQASPIKKRALCASEEHSSTWPLRDDI